RSQERKKLTRADFQGNRIHGDHSSKPLCKLKESNLTSAHNIHLRISQEKWHQRVAEARNGLKENYRSETLKVRASVIHKCLGLWILSLCKSVFLNTTIPPPPLFSRPDEWQNNCSSLLRQSTYPCLTKTYLTA